MGPKNNHGRIASLILGSAFGAYTLIGVFYLDFVNFWDAGILARCLAKKAYEGAPLLQSGCANHISFAFFYLLALPQRVLGVHAVVLNATLMALGILGIWAFYRCTRFLNYDQDEMGRSLLTLIFAIHPAFVVNTYFMTYDFGLLVFFLVALMGTLERRLIVQIAGGFFLCFTKEVGVLLNCILVGLSCFLFVTDSLNHGKKGRELWKSILIHASPLAIPFLAFAVFALGIRTEAYVWDVDVRENWISKIFILVDRKVVSFLILIFILNFNWVLSLPALLAVLTSIFRNISGYLIVSRKRVASSQILSSPVFAVFFLVVVFAITRVRPFSNVRYILSTVPLVIWAGWLGLKYIGLSNLFRQACLCLTAACLLIANFFTFDPLSRAIYGTFKFGKHDMLAMNSITGECCNRFGTDQLVYNLQILNFHYLLDMSFREMRPNGKTTIVGHRAWNHSILDPLEHETFKRTLNRQNSFTPIYIFDDYDFAKNINELFFLEPVFFLNDPILAIIEKDFTISRVITLDRFGYQLKLRHYVRQPNSKHVSQNL